MARLLFPRIFKHGTKQVKQGLCGTHGFQKGFKIAFQLGKAVV
jgi:hypothetical protein